jgi:glyoxylase-like metal-dependent hydrolase (beta-lactamase superfamily II)
MTGKNLFIECLNIGPFQVNTYIIACAKTGEACIIDPGGDPDRIIGTMETLNAIPRFILNTHGHQDHVAANGKLAEIYGIPVCMHEADHLFFQKQTAFQAPEVKKNYEVTRPLHHDETLIFGKLVIRVIHTPGHTPGSVCFLVEERLFSGDTLFVGSAGRTDLPGGDLDALIQSIKTRITVLPKETMILPGHDYGTTPFSTLKRECEENIYITDF